MARLIDADKLTEKLLHFACRLEDWNRPEQAEAVRAVAKGIKLEKTVDAVPVVHGRWEKSEYNGFIRCDHCKDVYISEEWLKDGKWNYCPNCAAHMDLEVKDDT